MIRIGHRGAAGHAPENTLSAIRAAVNLGVDFAELDVQLTADNHFVAMHDKRVDRTTSGTGLVTDLSLSALGNLVIEQTERVPVLEDVLELASDRIGLMLEIITPGSGMKLKRAVDEFRFRGPVIYASFLHREIAQIREAEESALTLALLEGVPVNPCTFAKDARANYAGVAFESATADYIHQLQASGFPAFVYTVNRREDLATAESFGVTGIISDYPERIPH